MPADDRVLLLDMRAAERGRLAASISRLGYVAILAEDVAAAQAIWEREAFLFVIVELRDQHAHIAELRAQLPGSAIIVIGRHALVAALEALHAGADKGQQPAVVAADAVLPAAPMAPDVKAPAPPPEMINVRAPASVRRWSTRSTAVWHPPLPTSGPRSRPHPTWSG